MKKNRDLFWCTGCMYISQYLVNLVMEGGAKDLGLLEQLAVESGRRLDPGHVCLLSLASHQSAPVSSFPIYGCCYYSPNPLL